MLKKMKAVYTTSQKFEMTKISLLCSPRLHSFDQKHSKDSHFITI